MAAFLASSAFFFSSSAAFFSAIFCASGTFLRTGGSSFLGFSSSSDSSQSSLTSSSTSSSSHLDFFGMVTWISCSSSIQLVNKGAIWTAYSITYPNRSLSYQTKEKKSWCHATTRALPSDHVLMSEYEILVATVLWWSMDRWSFTCSCSKNVALSMPLVYVWRHVISLSISSLFKENVFIAWLLVLAEK